MRYIIPFAIAALLLTSSPVLAQTQSVQELIQQLQQQIANLKTQIEALQKQEAETREASQDVRNTLKLLRQLREGMSGDDVKLLQEILATDPEIYPEGLVTGFFGPLTRNAIMRFQKKHGFSQVGQVGPQTLNRINQILTEGAGSSGKVPPGLLVAPGIAEKLGFKPQPLPGQTLPPGIEKKLGTSTPPGGTPTTTPDTTPPVISGIVATSTTASTTKIVWNTNEQATSKVWHGTSTPVSTSGNPSASSNSLVLSHNLALNGLSASTTYYYIVSSTDAAGNTATSSEHSFTTLVEEVE